VRFRGQRKISKFFVVGKFVRKTLENRVMFRVYLEVQEQNKAGVLLFAADNITLPSLTRRWLAERLAVLYHKSYYGSTCPTLAKEVKELDFAYLRGTRTYYCAVLKQHFHTPTSCFVSRSRASGAAA
jgi:hypothetical protein